MIRAIFTPFAGGSAATVRLLIVGQVALALVLWHLAPASTGLPTLAGIASEFHRLASTQGLLGELLASTSVIWQALVLSSLLSAGVAYLTTTAAFRPLGTVVSTLRFLGFAGLTFLFTLWTDGPHQLKLALLTFGMTVFLTRSMTDVVASIPAADLDYGRTLGLTGWRLTWEMVVRGRLADFLELVRQNAAVGWTLLAMVEGITRSEGGVGAMLLNQNKYFNLSAVFAIQLVILTYGVAQDWALSALRDLACPHARLARDRK